MEYIGKEEVQKYWLHFFLMLLASHAICGV